MTVCDGVCCVILAFLIRDVPQDWKVANVTPILKKVKKLSSANYRPISLTVNLCKIFESLVKDK